MISSGKRFIIVIKKMTIMKCTVVQTDTSYLIIFFPAKFYVFMGDKGQN